MFKHSSFISFFMLLYSGLQPVLLTGFEDFSLKRIYTHTSLRRPITKKWSKVNWGLKIKHAEELTSWSSDSVTFRIEQTADLHEVTAALRDVFIHAWLKKKGVVTGTHSTYSFLSWVDEDARSEVAHCLPHSLVTLNFGRLRSVSVHTIYNTIQYNSRLLKISKQTKAATAITGYNLAYSDTNQLMFPHRKQSTANT